MSMLLPRATRDPGALLPGAVLVGAVLAGMQAVAQLYLPDKLERASALYGALATTLVTLGTFFLVGRAMVFGMSLDAVIYERFGSISQFVFGLPIVRILPRQVDVDPQLLRPRSRARSEARSEIRLNRQPDLRRRRNQAAFAASADP